MPEKMDKSAFKIFVGNVSKKAKESEIRELFQKYGPVLETNIIRDYAFVHMENEEQAREAIRNLDSQLLHDMRIKCQPAVSRRPTETSQTSVKLFLGNLSERMKPDEIRDLFKDYGKVIELDIIRTYGFIHIEPNSDVNVSKIIRDLHLKQVDGQAIKVQVSTSRVRQKPGMGNSEQCYRCGRVGHWSRECPKLADGDRGRLARGYSAGETSSSSPPAMTAAAVLTAAAAAAAAAGAVPSSSSIYDRDRYLRSTLPSGSVRYEDYERYYERSYGSFPPDPYELYASRSSAAAAAVVAAAAAGVPDPYKLRTLDYDPLLASRPRGVSDYALYDNYAASGLSNPRQSNDPLLYGSHASGSSSASYSRRYAPY